MLQRIMGFNSTVRFRTVEEITCCRPCCSGSWVSTFLLGIILIPSRLLQTMLQRIMGFNASVKLASRCQFAVADHVAADHGFQQVSKLDTSTGLDGLQTMLQRIMGFNGFQQIRIALRI